MYYKYIFAFILISFQLYGGDVHSSITHGIDGSILSLYSILPFIGILLSIAIIPLISPGFWHHNYGKVSLFWSLMFIIPFIYTYGISLTRYEILHVLLLEYIPFIILLLSLYTVSGGIRLKGSLVGTPLLNVYILTIGTMIASWMGTTGAAMLLIRPLIRANKWRKNNLHIRSRKVLRRN